MRAAHAAIARPMIVTPMQPAKLSDKAQPDDRQQHRPADPEESEFRRKDEWGIGREVAIG